MAPLIADHWVIDNWAILLAAAVGIYLFGVPLLVLNGFRNEAQPTVQRVEPRMLPLPESVAEHLRAVEVCLEPEGFESQGIFLLPYQARNVRAFLSLFVNRATTETAVAVAIVAHETGDWNVAQYVEINTHYRSGRDINTGNLTEVSAFKAPPNTLTTHVPWISDPAELCEIHRAIVAAKGESAPAELRLDSQYDRNAEAYLAAVIREELEAAASDGYLRLDAAGTHYRPTLTGAYLMTWKQLPPFKRFVARARDRSAQGMLADVGLA